MDVTYDQLPEWERSLIEDVRDVIGDYSTDDRFKFFSKDSWARILQSAIRDFNKAKPFTSFDVENFPITYRSIIEIGTVYHAALSRANVLMEEPVVSGYTGPYVDRSNIYQRWENRAKDLAPEWRKARNLAKLNFLPGPAATVDYHSRYGYGRTASITPILRSLPSWGAGRIH